MLTTFDRSFWHELAWEENARRLLTTNSPEDEVRKLFPFKGVVLTPCMAYGVKKGDVLQYARTRHEVSTFPIECAFRTESSGSTLRVMSFKSEEVQLLEA